MSAEKLRPRPPERRRHVRVAHRTRAAPALACGRGPHRPARRGRLPVDDRARAHGGGRRDRGRAGPAPGDHVGLGGIRRPAAGSVHRDHHPGARRGGHHRPPRARRVDRGAGGRPPERVDSLPRTAGRVRRRTATPAPTSGHRGPIPCDRLAAAEATLAVCQRALLGLQPDDGATGTACPKFTVDDLVEHLVQSMVHLGAAAGASVPVVDAATPEARVAAAAQAALEAWRRRGLDGVVRLGPGEFPATVAANILSVEFLVHTWDLAQASGQEVIVSDEVAAYVLDLARELIAPPLRDGDRFGPEVEAGPDLGNLRASGRLHGPGGMRPAPGHGAGRTGRRRHATWRGAEGERIDRGKGSHGHVGDDRCGAGGVGRVDSRRSRPRTGTSRRCAPDGTCGTSWPTSTSPRARHRRDS